MDFAETTILGLIAINPSFQKKAAIVGLAIFIIAFLLGILLAFVAITMPLTDIYQTKYNELTKNDTLKCFDSTNMTNPILIDKLKLRDYCVAYYCSDIPLIGIMPDVKP
jgi:hypothetical protein